MNNARYAFTRVQLVPNAKDVLAPFQAQLDAWEAEELALAQAEHNHARETECDEEEFEAWLNSKSHDISSDELPF